MIRAVIFGLSVGDSHIHSSRTLPWYSHVTLALQLAKYPLAVLQLATRILPVPFPAAVSRSVRYFVITGDNNYFLHSGNDSVATGNSNGYLNNSLSPRVPEDTRKTPIGLKSLGTIISVSNFQNKTSWCLHRRLATGNVQRVCSTTYQRFFNICLGYQSLNLTLTLTLKIRENKTTPE